MPITGRVSKARIGISSRLRMHWTKGSRIKLARESMNPAVLAKLTRDRNELVRIEAAMNQHTLWPDAAEAIVRLEEDFIPARISTGGYGVMGATDFKDYDWVEETIEDPNRSRGTQAYTAPTLDAARKVIDAHKIHEKLILEYVKTKNPELCGLLAGG